MRTVIDEHSRDGERLHVQNRVLVSGLGIAVEGVGFRVWGAGFRFYGVGFRV